MNIFRFTLSNRDRTRLYETSMITILVILYEKFNQLLTECCSLDQTDLRDSSKSKESRDEGSKLFQAKDYEKALDKFSEAILLAPIKIEKNNNISQGGNKGNFLSFKRNFLRCNQT
jgi:hypothetical protein